MLDRIIYPNVKNDPIDAIVLNAVSEQYLSENNRHSFDLYEIKNLFFAGKLVFSLQYNDHDVILKPISIREINSPVQELAGRKCFQFGSSLYDTFFAIDVIEIEPGNIAVFGWEI